MIDANVAWPLDRIAEASEAVARSRGWASRDSAGVETEAVTLRYAAIDSELRSLGAAMLAIDSEHLLAIVRTDARHAHVMTPDGRRVVVPLRELRELLSEGVEARFAPDVDRVLSTSGIAERRRERARAAMLRDLVGDAPVGQLWIIRPRLENVRAVVSDVHLLRKAIAFVGMNAAELLLYVLSWWILGLMAFDTRSLDTLFALWLLAVLTIVPLRAAGVAAARSLIMEAGSMIKRRILLGALKLSPDEVNGKGVGTFLSHVLESGHVEAFGTNGAFTGLTSIITGIAAIFVLSRGAGGVAHVALYLLWIVIAAVITVRFGLGRAAWTEARFGLTGHVVENMTGHKTRLVQKEPDARNDGEDLRLEKYMSTEVTFNRSALHGDLLRRIWQWAGLFALAPIVAAGSASRESLAVAAAGVLLGSMALTHWTDASSDMAASRTSRPHYPARRAHPASRPVRLRQIDAVGAPQRRASDAIGVAVFSRTRCGHGRPRELAPAHAAGAAVPRQSHLHRHGRVQPSAGPHVATVAGRSSGSAGSLPRAGTRWAHRPDAARPGAAGRRNGMAAQPRRTDARFSGPFDSAEARADDPRRDFRRARCDHPRRLHALRARSAGDAPRRRASVKTKKAWARLPQALSSRSWLVLVADHYAAALDIGFHVHRIHLLCDPCRLPSES
jgi:hypothetical protein